MTHGTRGIYLDSSSDLDQSSGLRTTRLLPNTMTTPSSANDI
jgi:hypothetical protein